MENQRKPIQKITNPYSRRKSKRTAYPSRVSFDSHSSSTCTSSSTSVQLHSTKPSVENASPIDESRLRLVLPLNDCTDSRTTFDSPDIAGIDLAEFDRKDDFDLPTETQNFIQTSPEAQKSCTNEPKRLYYQNDTSVLSRNTSEPPHHRQPITCQEHDSSHSCAKPAAKVSNISNSPTTNTSIDNDPCNNASLPPNKIKNGRDGGNHSSSTIDKHSLRWENSKTPQAEKGAGQKIKKRKSANGSNKNKSNQGNKRDEKQRKLTEFSDKFKQIRDADEEEPMQATTREENDSHPFTLRALSDGDTSGEDDPGNRKINGLQRGQLSQEEAQTQLRLFTQTLTQCVRDHHERAAKHGATTAPRDGFLRDEDDNEDEELLDLGEKELGLSFSALTQDQDDDDAINNEKGSSNRHAGGIKPIQVDEDLDSYEYHPTDIGEHKRTYTKGDHWYCTSGKLYTIVGFKLKGCTSKKAICRELIRMSQTILVEDDRWIKRNRLEAVDLKKLKYKEELNKKLFNKRWERRGGVRMDEKKLRLSDRYGFAYTPDEETIKKKMFHPPTMLDLFAGVGGMSCGQEQAGFRTTHAVEWNDLAASFLELNFSEPLEVYIECVNLFLDKVEQGAAGYPKKGDENHINACSPCNAFSTANREENGGKNGLRNNMLVHTWARAIRLFDADTGSFENVTGFLLPKHAQVYLKRMVAELLIELNYSIRVCVLNSASFGDPQSRWRVIIFVSKMGFPLALEPKATHGKRGLPKIKTVRDAIKDLENIQPVCGSGRVQLEDGTVVLNHSIDGTEMKSESERVDPNQPAKTLYGNSSYNLAHYKENRLLTIRELARLQSFPDTFRFPSNRNVARKLIHNAVPVNLALAVGRSLMECYDLRYDS